MDQAPSAGDLAPSAILPPSSSFGNSLHGRMAIGAQLNILGIQLLDSKNSSAVCQMKR